MATLDEFSRMRLELDRLRSQLEYAPFLAVIERVVLQLDEAELPMFGISRSLMSFRVRRVDENLNPTDESGVVRGVVFGAYPPALLDVFSGNLTAEAGIEVAQNSMTGIETVDLGETYEAMETLEIDPSAGNTQPASVSEHGSHSHGLPNHVHPMMKHNHSLRVPFDETVDLDDGKVGGFFANVGDFVIVQPVLVGSGSLWFAVGCVPKAGIDRIKEGRVRG